jgi:hypothetical protein
MSDHENKLADYLDYPYDRFLKLRLEFLIITQNDLESRILRVIERCIENERFYLNRQATNRNQQIDLSGIIFVTISHKLFLQELYGIVQSETTLRDALAHLEEQHLIFRESGDGGPYDPPYYALNKPLIEHLFSLLPPLEEIDMLAVMKQPRKPRKPKESEEELTGVQKLEVQKLHPLIEGIRDAKIAPPDPQLLDPQGYKNWRASRTRGVQKLDPNKIYKDSKKKKESRSSQNEQAPTLASHDASSVLSFFEQLSDEQKQAFLRAAHLTEKKQQSSSSSTNKKPAQPTQASLLEDELTSKARTTETPQPTESELEIERRWRHWQKYINNRRGGPLRARGLIINEQESLKDLVKEFSDEEIVRVDTYLSTEHWKYKTNPHTIGGKQLLDESRPALQLLNGREKKPQQQTKKAPDDRPITVDDFRKPLLPAGMRIKQS